MPINPGQEPVGKEAARTHVLTEQDANRCRDIGRVSQPCVATRCYGSNTEDSHRASHGSRNQVAGSRPVRAVSEAGSGREANATDPCAGAGAGLKERRATTVAAILIDAAVEISVAREETGAADG